jgi:uncharacterized protein YbjT (DUF2867 family)
MSKFAFIAGATGAAATRLVEELLRQNWRIIAVSRKAPKGQADGNLTYFPAERWVIARYGEIKSRRPPPHSITSSAVASTD